MSDLPIYSFIKLLACIYYFICKSSQQKRHSTTRFLVPPTPSLTVSSQSQAVIVRLGQLRLLTSPLMPARSLTGTSLNLRRVTNMLLCIRMDVI